MQYQPIYSTLGRYNCFLLTHSLTVTQSTQFATL